MATFDPIRPISLTLDHSGVLLDQHGLTQFDLDHLTAALETVRKKWP